MRLRYTRPALADFNALLEAIAIHSPQAAHRVQRRIEAVIELLLVYPGIGAYTDAREIQRVTTSPYPYLVFYQATQAEIIIHAVRHGARNPSGMPGAA